MTVELLILLHLDTFRFQFVGIKESHHIFYQAIPVLIKLACTTRCASPYQKAHPAIFDMRLHRFDSINDIYIFKFTHS